MENKDPNLYVAEKLGELSGVISGLSGKIDGIKDDMKEKIGRDTCENIVNEAIEEHRKEDHKKSSVVPQKSGGPVLSPMVKRVLINAAVIVTTAALTILAAWLSR